MSEQDQLSFLIDTQPASRVCVFVNSISNPVAQKVIDDSSLITLPFPPTINPHDLVVPRPDGHVSRPPTTFIIYRRLFFETARAAGYNFPMNVISSMASKSWEKESDSVKKEYRRISREAFNYYNEIFPKSKPQKKRDLWRTVSFDKSTRKAKITKSIKSVNNDRSVKSSELEFTLNHDLPLSSPDISQMPSNLNVNSPELNLDLNVNRTDLFDQNVYRSPDISNKEFNSEFLSTATQYFDLSIQANQQIILQATENNVNDNLFVDEGQYEFGASGFSNEILETGQFGIFDTQNFSTLDNFVCSNNSNEMNEMCSEQSFSPNLLN
ncbi:24150_t:CDS:1 [Dentiscutata erythropus]|uniref:24150_t:CDS:1 n=1 Tax=Dentiscutata erythropus TaxID=1348616 RepID=A0A9N9FUR4_9GLOM|nr:24150_t:CDS:1 [Dentiscutata erythropus]